MSPMNEADFDLGEGLGEGVRLPSPAGPPSAAEEGASGPIAQGSVARDSALELVGGSGRFTAVQPALRRRIAALGREQDYAGGGVVVGQGAADDEVDLVISGAVRISRTVPG